MVPKFRATLSGDDEAFAKLVRRHRGRVFNTASRFARDSHQLDDLCQEVFLRAFRHLAKFCGDAPFEHWLARITISACYDLKIVWDAGTELSAATAEVRPKVEEILGHSEDRIRDVLDEDQRKKFDSFVNEGRRRWKSAVANFATHAPRPASPPASPAPR